MSDHLPNPLIIGDYLMSITYHLGDCMQACDKCAANYHAAFDEICPLCYADLTKENN